MTDVERALRPEERLSARLRALYGAWGYAPYKVGRFEEYELYMRNKSFLTDERVLAFADTDGKLMALKPDITLSVVKNTREEDMPLKIAYAESVYRVPRGAQGFREIMQAGVEAIGELTEWDFCEVMLLAARSLQLIRPDGWQLDVSDMGIIASVLSGAILTAEEQALLLSHIRSKDAQGLAQRCVALGVPEDIRTALLALVETAGPLLPALERLESIGLPPACLAPAASLRAFGEAAQALGLSRVSLDFSVASDMSYYNGVIFAGFADGVHTSVLSGGRYDPLMARMGKRGKAIGFAVYLDQAACLADTAEDREAVSVPGTGTPAEIALRCEALIREGRRVRVTGEGEEP